MVSILPSKVSPWQALGKAMTQLGRNTPELMENRYQRGQLQESLDAIKNLSKKPESSPLDIMLETMKAGAGIPGSERYLGQLIPQLMKVAEANKSQKIPLAGEEMGRGQPAQRQQLPNFLNQQQNQQPEFFPSNVGPSGGPGNVPQEATLGVKQPLFTVTQLIPKAKELAKERSDSGIPTTAKEALEELKDLEKEKKDYNKEVDKELGQRTTGQQTYGQRAVTELKKVYPEASSEVETIFQKIGEDASKLGKSEAEINRYLANEAKNFKNTIANVRNDMDAPRLYNAITRGLNGTYKNFEQAGADVRKHLDPLIDLGLYDTARNLLSEKGYGPEEREMIIHPLGSESKALINQVPKYSPIETGKGKFGVKANEPPNLDNIKSTLMQMKQKDPNFSLVLARKAFEDKGYDWRSFKDALNDVMSQDFELTDDQKAQSGILNEPPLQLLGSILQGLNLIGR